MIVLVVLLAVLGATSYLLLNSERTQTWLTTRIASYLSGELHTQVSVNRVSFKPFRTLILEGVLVKDQSSDTLAYIGKLKGKINQLSPGKRRLYLTKLELQKTDFNLRQIDTSGTTNLDFIVDYFNSADTTAQQPWTLAVQNFTMQKSSFSYRKPGRDSLGAGIDFDDLALHDVHMHIENFRTEEDTLLGTIDHLGFKEKSGFELDTLSAQVKLSSSELVAGDMRIITPFTTLIGDLHYNYNGYRSYKDFVDEVNMHYSFNTSVVDISDIAYFAPELHDFNNKVTLSGNFRGPVKNLKGRDVRLGYGNFTRFRGSFDLTGLPHPKSLFVNLSADELQTRYSDLQTISAPTTNPHERFTPPEILKQMGLMRFHGSFTGFLNDFVTYGIVQSQLGKLKTDLKLKDLPGNKIRMHGKLNAIDFDVGKLLGQSKVGNVSAAIQVDAHGPPEKLEGKARGNISTLNVAGYSYNSISLNGTFAPGRFNGNLKSRDENLIFDFNGLVDLQGERPIMDFAASVYHADLAALNLVDKGDSLDLSTSLKLNASGSNPEDFSGTLTAQNTSLCRGDEAYNFDRINLNSQQFNTTSKLSLSADFLDFNLVGKYHIRSVLSSLSKTLNTVFPSQFSYEYDKEGTPQDFTFSGEVKKPGQLMGLLQNRYIVAPQTIFSGEYNSNEGRINLFLRSDSIGYNKFMLRQLKLDAEKQEEFIYLQSTAFQFNLFDSLEVENFTIDAKAFQDELEVDMGWRNANQRSSGKLAVNAYAVDSNSYTLDLMPTQLNFFNQQWAIRDTATIRVDSSAVNVSQFKLRGDKQLITLNGSISRNPDDIMKLDVDSLDLSILSHIPGFHVSKLGGTLNLEANIKDLYKLRQINSDVQILDLALDKRRVGKAVFSSSWNGEKKAIEADGYIYNKKIRALDFKGAYYPGQAKNNMDLTLSMNEFDLGVFNTFDLKIISHLSGKASGDIGITGTLEDPVLEGTVDFDNMIFRVDYLGTEYRFNDEVRVEDGWMGIDYKPIYDEFGHKGNVVAQAYHTNFENWNFDVYAEVEDFQLLNTSATSNELYYGDAFGTGSVQIGGYPDNLEINVEVTTEENTVLKVPLNESSEVKLGNFVHFVGPAGEDSLSKDNIDLTGIDMDLDIEATPDAEVQLIFDELVGDVLKTRGSGNLKFEITPTGNFSMYGPYKIKSGNYLFSLQGVVKKRFFLEQGGTIRWYGDPYQADINLNAVYNMRAALYDIMVGEQNQEAYRNRVPVELVMKLSNQLTNPDIAFDIRLPSSGETERSQLESVINTDLERNKQVFALLVMNRFLPPAGSGQGPQELGASSVSATTTDLVSNTVSNWLSQLSEEVNVGIEYRPGDNISSEELAVALSTYLFNERLLVSGNFGVRDDRAASDLQKDQSELIGDFELQYLITEDGRIRMKVYNRSNTYDVTETNPNGFTQGVGLVYQEDFDTFSDFFDKVKGIFSKKKSE